MARRGAVIPSETFWRLGVLLSVAGFGCLFVTGWPVAGTILAGFGLLMIWRSTH